MRNLIINDELVEADLGEGLLAVARRNRSHIGFVCDGNGLCTTCEYRIMDGAENLSEPNDIERTWIPTHRLEKGYRLACQSSLMGRGEVRILTRAEELRRLWNNIFTPPAGTTSGDNLGRAWGYVLQLNVDHLSMFPVNLLRTVNRLGLPRTLLPVQDNDVYFQDIGAIIDKQSDNAFSDRSQRRRSVKVEVEVEEVVVEEVELL